MAQLSAAACNKNLRQMTKSDESTFQDLSPILHW